MADSFHSLNYHFIWSTKGRRPLLTSDIETRVWEYIAGLARSKRMLPICIGGHRDHVHALVRVPPNLDVSKAIQLLKGPSSKWMSDTFPGLRDFQWQDGYGAFTVSRSGIGGVIEYIKGQAEHHRVKSFRRSSWSFW
jgi:putative transposase